MTEIHAFPGRRLPAQPPRRSTSEIDLTSEAIRRGVQYLAFRAADLDLVAKFEPGPGQVNGRVAHAAHAALKAHQRLIPELEAAPPSPARSAAVATRLAFARQLADVKAGVTRAPTTALRSAYLDALAEFIIETVHRDGASALEAD